MAGNVNLIRSASVGEPAEQRRSLSRRVKPSGNGGADWSNPPRPANTSLMVGDGTVGKSDAVSRETVLGPTAFMLNPMSRRTARHGVRAFIVATKRVTTVERRNAGRWTDERQNTGRQTNASARKG